MVREGDHRSDGGWRSRRLAKAAVLAVAIAALTGAGLSGALAKHGADDWGDWDIASGGSGGSGWDDVASGGGENDWVFASGGSGGGDWDDDWTVASGGSGGWDDD